MMSNVVMAGHCKSIKVQPQDTAMSPVYKRGSSRTQALAMMLVVMTMVMMGASLLPGVTLMLMS